MSHKMPNHITKKGKNYSAFSSRMNDWMRAVTAPTPYRVGSPFRFNISKFSQNWSIFVFLFLIFFFFIYINQGENSSHIEPNYNKTYPLSSPIRYPNGDVQYNIAVISDLDRGSKLKEGEWISYMKRGSLYISSDFKNIKVSFDTTYTLTSHFNFGNKAMELSELIAFNGKLYSCDDRTGMVFEISHDQQMLPFVLLKDGDGNNANGFKCEWMAVKDGVMWVGGLGKEWTDNQGNILHQNPQWVKKVTHRGEVTDISWVGNYNRLRLFGGFEHPGYLIHEGVVWSEYRKNWVFMPRRASTEYYNDVKDEMRASNLIFFTNEDFSDITMSTFGTKHPSRGVSSFKFIPGTSDTVIIVLKSEEVSGKMASYISVHDLQTGKELLKDTKIDDMKFEGVEFV